MRIHPSSSSILIALIALNVTCVVVVAQDLAPSPDHPLGWRGDGSGKYLNANPPLDFGRISKSVTELSTQAGKPNNDAPPGKASALKDGIIREWLVLGPLPITKETKPEDILSNIPALSPDEHEKLGDAAWQKVKLDSDCLDFCSIFNVPPDKIGVAAFAHAYIYSPSGQSVAYNVMFQGQGSSRVWLNGAVIFGSPNNIDLGMGARLVLPLKKGWNRLLVLNARTLNFRQSWWINGSFFGDKNPDYDSHGIVWRTPLPACASSAPVIMGDRIAFTMESGCVMCVNKADGKPMWCHTLTYYDFATDEERKAKPEIFAALAPMDERLKKEDQTDLAVPWKMPELEAYLRYSLEGQLYGGMSKVSFKKYGAPAECEVGVSAPTPITDGQFVYAVFGNGICACYDRDGNRKWMHLVDHKQVEHGYTASPLLVDGKLIVYFNNLTILNAKTGEVIVERPHFLAPGTQFNWYTHFHGIGQVLNAGNEKILYYLNGEFVRLSDGKTLDLDDKKLTILGPAHHTDISANRIAAMLVDDGIAYKIGDGRKVVAFKIPALNGDKVEPEIIREIPIDISKFPYYYGACYDASPLIHQGLMYLVTDFGALTVLDLKTGETVYQKQLDLEVFMPYSSPDCRLKGGVSASPTLAGKYIYFFGNQGAVLIIEPGHTYKQVARLRLESQPENQPPYNFQHQDVTMTEPVFEGDRMYYHSENALFCIGPK
jgi:outer membrane protein assembly factor BamB